MCDPDTEFGLSAAAASPSQVAQDLARVQEAEAEACSQTESDRGSDSDSEYGEYVTAPQSRLHSTDEETPGAAAEQPAAPRPPAIQLRFPSRCVSSPPAVSASAELTQHVLGELATEACTALGRRQACVRAEADTRRVSTCIGLCRGEELQEQALSSRVNSARAGKTPRAVGSQPAASPNLRARKIRRESEEWDCCETERGATCLASLAVHVCGSLHQLLQAATPAASPAARVQDQAQERRVGLLRD